MKITNAGFKRRALLGALLTGCMTLSGVAAGASDPLAGILIHDFDNGLDGFNPTGGLALDPNGLFYSTTSLSGAGGGAGTVFSIGPTGTPFTTLYSFVGPEGNQPISTLVRGANGNYYGVAAVGGSDDQGAVFMVTTAGVITTLHSFIGTDGAIPIGAPVLAGDGNFYGTTARGGAFSLGTMYRISPTGAFTLLHSFAPFQDGAIPTGALVQASDGNFYGTTALAGPVQNNAAAGTVFRATPSGVVTVLHSFVGLADGSGPYAGLTIGSDGNFYGTTEGGGNGDRGVVFRMNTVGDYTVLHRFTGADGGGPRGSLLEGRGIDNSTLYGTTQFGGTFEKGVAYRISRTGTYSVLYNFDNPVGNNPTSELAYGPDGGLYGNTIHGGRESGSTYRLLPKYTFKIGAEDGVPVNPVDQPIAYLRGKTYTEIKVCLTNPSGAVVTVPFTLTPSNTSPLEYDILTPANQTLVFQPGQTEQIITLKTKYPPAYLQCNQTYTFTLGPASNAKPGDITTNVLTVRNPYPLTGNLVCRNN